MWKSISNNDEIIRFMEKVCFRSIKIQTKSVEERI